jgi:hypothetical protein
MALHGQLVVEVLVVIPETGGIDGSGKQQKESQKPPSPLPLEGERLAVI